MTGSERARASVAQLLRRMPPWLNAVFDFGGDVIVRGTVDAVRTARAGRRPPSSADPAPTPVPLGPTRMLVAPMNFAGQGHAWAQAVSANLREAAATNLAVEYPDSMGFPADRTVPVTTYRYDRRWQRREAAHIAAEFTHLLVEAEAPIFGTLFRGDPSRERAFLTARGVSVAYISHGSDLRSPRGHAARTRFSPFNDADVYVDRIQRRVDRNRALLRRSGSPVFLSTPDLIEDYADAAWVPVVVDVAEWSMPVQVPDGGGAMAVLHTPSRRAVKGSHLIRGVAERLAASGNIRYTEVSGVPAARIKEEVRRADVVLDQFRLGSYGVAACEAMAAGRVVVGHVTAPVRAYVREQTGHDLPIVEADPESLEVVLRGLAADPSRREEIGAAGRRFAREVHDGRFSAAILDRHWLRTEEG